MGRGILVYLLMVVLLGGLVFGCTSAPKPQPEKPAPAPAPKAEEPKPKPIVLKAISFLPVDHPLMATIPAWIEKVGKATDGLVTVNWVGGPEVTPALEQIEAVRTGVVDVNFNVTAYYEPLAPELRAFSLSERTPWEERQVGFYDFMVERHKKVGTMYLGRWLSEQSFYLWVNKPVQELADLKGRKLRTRALYDRFMRELGIVPVSVDHGEVYTSLERGMVEGFGWPILGPADYGWTEVTKYVIDHPFFNQNATILVNLDVWNRIPANLQQAIMKATAEYERDMVAHFIEASRKERERLQGMGVQFIRFSPEEGERYAKTALEVEWQFLVTQVPDMITDLKKISSK